jgi:starch synthase
MPASPADDGAARARIAFLAAESAPLTAPTRVGEFVRCLPRELVLRGHRPVVFLPGYGSIDRAQYKPVSLARQLEVRVADRTEVARFERLSLDGVDTVLVGHDAFFDRPGRFGDGAGDYVDNAERFSFFTQAALAFLDHEDEPPDLIHAHDWPTALAPIYRAMPAGQVPGRGRTEVVFSVHHLGAQGVFEKSRFRDLNLPRRHLVPGDLEHFGKLNLLQSGIRNAGAVILPGPRYAAEAGTEDGGRGLDDVLRSRGDRVYGVLCGVDPAGRDPARDRYLKANYGIEDLIGKRSCKLDLQGELGLEANLDAMVVGVTSRLSEDKGTGLLVEALPQLLKLRIQIAVVGTGERRFEEYFRDMASRYPGQVGLNVSGNDFLTHKLMAGADVVLLGSRHEADGRDAICALGYGAVPVVHATGVLHDLVPDYDPVTRQGNGFQFSSYRAQALAERLREASELFHNGPEAWRGLVVSGMRADHSWSAAAKGFEQVYREVSSPARREGGGKPAGVKGDRKNRRA